VAILHTFPVTGPTLLELAARYRFSPRPCTPARGNEKGRVERAIRYIRASFFAARAYKDLDDLNVQAREWTLGIAAERLQDHHEGAALLGTL
jgi:transposase